MSEAEIAYRLHDGSFKCWGCKRKRQGPRHLLRNPRTKRHVTLCDACNERNKEAQRAAKGRRP